jgi:hypothetical protein
MIVHGQIHGGIAQGVGQALVEDCCYDPRSGQLLPARSWIMRCRVPTCCRSSRPNSPRCQARHIRGAFAPP